MSVKENPNPDEPARNPADKLELNIDYSIDNIQLSQNGEISPYSFLATNCTKIISNKVSRR
jgi:hypothetical protein